MDISMIAPTAFDWDGDGDLDISCGEESGRVAFLENVGTMKGKMPVFRSPRFFRQEAESMRSAQNARPL